ncbi:uncharacterized protein EDB91DRAFT_1147121 [Suillus paluster]|uniref:uncharacterized protein n=1 Tax=Suillus paluster TaxID=48578 RepID=UPI001B8671AB|nr:uncharacterized protein EDB91DRAFT_1147121 [Suillus paluster]KAG1734261.1 hypothetical protein EDB91DRAFT_1147121 [Suillus paluster]
MGHRTCRPVPMKLSALLFVLASALTVLAAPIYIGIGGDLSVARTAFEGAREVCELRSSSVCGSSSAHSQSGWEVTGRQRDAQSGLADKDWKRDAPTDE